MKEIFINDNVKYEFMLNDKMFNKLEVVVYAQEKAINTDFGIERYYKVVTIDVVGTTRKYLKDLNVSNSGWNLMQTM